MNKLKLALILTLSAPGIAFAQNATKIVSGPSDNPPYAAIKPYWIDKPVAEIIGRANVMFNPNRATMSFSVREINDNADEGLAILTKRTKPVIDKVKTMLGKDDSITVNYRRVAIYQQYKDKDGNKIENTREDKIENYALYWDISITTEKLNLVPQIKAEILAIGNSNMNGTESYDFVPTTEQSRSLFKAAIEDGQARADIVAQGKKLRLLVVQEGQTQCLSSPTTENGNEYSKEYNITGAPPPSPVLAFASPPPPPSQKSILQANDLIMPSSPDKHTMDASVCMVYAIDW